MPIYHHTNPATPPTINHYFSGANGKYFDAQSLARIVEGLIAAHPDLVETIDLPNKTYGYDGAATTAEDGQAVDANRVQMKLYRIHGAKDCARHGIFVYGSPHSREWVPKHACIEAIYRVLKNYGNDAYLTELLDEVDIFYIPDANPDGSMYSFHDSANFRRNRHKSGGAPESWPCSTDNNCKVDINRNYSVGFGTGSSSSNCSNEAYHGVCRLSEPETQNISWVVKQYPKIWVSITAHSAGNQIFWPVAPPGTMPQLDSADAKSQSPDELLGGTTLQRSGWFNYMAQRARAAIYDHRSTVLDQDGFTPGPNPAVGSKFGSGISTYEMYFNHTDNPLTDRYKTVKSTQWYEHPHKVYQYTFEISGVGQRPAWSEADELIMEWANGILEVVACTRDLSHEDVFGLEPIASEDWLNAGFNNTDRSRAWGSDWTVTGSHEMLTNFYCHSGDHSVRIMSTGRLERTVDMTGRVGNKLTFAWRAASWESSDKVYVKVNDGSGWTTVKTFSDGVDDYYYHNVEIDLSAYNATSDFKIAIEGGMSSTSDWFYVDHLKLLGYEALAYDDFNSNGFSGGQGWVGAWTTSGSSSIDADYPLEGGYCAKILATGKIERQVNLSGVLDPKLIFDSRSVYFETGDEAYVKVDDGNSVTTVLTLKPEDCDKVYHQHVIDLSSYARSSTFKVIFEGGMNSTTDYWYIDRVRVSGVKAVAADDFESADFNGGKGFSYAWTVSGATITKTQQFSGYAAAEFANNANITRTVDLSSHSNAKLSFVACVSEQFASGDSFTVKVDDGNGWVTVKTLGVSDNDGYYHRFSLDLSAYNHVSTFKIGFEGAINTSNARVYIDKVAVE